MKHIIIFFTFILGLCQCILQVHYEWPDGFRGTLLVPINELNKGWELELQFNKSVTVQVLYGEVEEEINGQILKYRSKYAKYCWPMPPFFNFEFIANGSVTASNLIGAVFNGAAVNISVNVDFSSPKSPLTPINVLTSNGTYDYGSVLYASLLFYESQRSGRLPANSRIVWRGDSLLNDGEKDGIDLSGGYYTDADLAKDSHEIAGLTTILAWGAIDYEDAYIKSNQSEYVRDAIRWSTDYLIKAHVGEREFIRGIQYAGSDAKDFWRPEDGPGEKNCGYPRYIARRLQKLTCNYSSSEVVGEAAAALAAASIIFRLSDPDYHSKLLIHARQLYNFANECRGAYIGFFNSWSSRDCRDALAWAAVWLYRATNEERYLLDAKQHINEFNIKKMKYMEYTFESGNRDGGVQVLLAKMTGEEIYRKQIEEICNVFVRTFQKTPKGLLFIHKDNTLKRAANVAFLCLQAADIGINREEYFNFTTRQIGYMLGDTGRSYVVGVGKNYPQYIRDRGSSCPSPPVICNNMAYANPHPNLDLLIGALVAGPDINDVYEDGRYGRRDRDDVSVESNAGFQSAVAGYFIIR